jgi:hypothetical protein
MARSFHIDEVLSSVHNARESHQFMHAQQVVRDHLVYTREIPKGRISSFPDQRRWWCKNSILATSFLPISIPNRSRLIDFSLPFT